MNLRMIFISILFIGIGIFSFSLTQKKYNDEGKGQELLNQSFQLSDAEYDKKDAQLRTSKNQFMDIGSGLMVSSTAILIFLFFKKIETISDLKKTQSLSKTGIFIWANLFWLLLIPGTYLYYWFRAVRGDYSPNADSIGIPIMIQTPVIWFGLIPLNLFLMISILKSKLPSTLFSQLNFKSFATSFWEIIFGLLVILNQIILISAILDGDHIMIITNLFFTFILLSLRSGKNISINGI